MPTFIALLRGINVAGQKKVPMAALREVLTKSGLEQVRTYIQSGNVIFEANNKNTQQLAEDIHKSIKAYFGFEVPILIKTPTQLQQILDACPFPETQKQNSYFSLLYATPRQELIDEVSTIKYPNETVSITKNCIYFYCSAGYGRTKYNNNFFERKLNVTATARNYKTMVKLLSLSQ
ncbi:hypothetical protein IA57_07180 [Mangrovimonas yunxiaonensis]|uniref:DUF1697 domain-containing protein n=1 Tax=Mangrovimonas yunxiaonensis TaxID=1197477 RepID=A0A084TLL8_9FLAO|nr:DUF1697 domain-containing protein [Mangrovimonas yunxiaonensis]KFB01604.1 hypothetical protein IA57_07180 [Mangrovimonas yunxiaonensis]GGH35701.1 hypothetical protein GCM10011364_02440 [Mangrovimonas yunxiaonensis]